MDFSILSLQGFEFLLRWAHFLAGVTWIGILWYFNFIQGAFFKEIDAEVKKVATQKLVPRALWWFRWGAMFTIITGVLIIAIRLGHYGIGIDTMWATTILFGGAMGIVMWFNVWFVIWPAQQVVIAAANGEAAENVPARGRRAFIASRTNTLLSIPMLFYMASASHSTFLKSAAGYMSWYIITGIILVAIEINALTATDGIGSKPIETTKGVITSGVILTIIFYVLSETVLKG